jgi:hypothetical protein
MVKFKSLPLAQLERILDRAKPADRMALAMDLAAVNATCPIDGGKLVAFPDFDFWHDISGIQRHIDRTTGKLGDFFLPRCARADEGARERFMAERGY